MIEQPHGVEYATEVAEVFQGCAEVLRGHHAYVQGAALADLLAMLIAGFKAADEKETPALHEAILAEHIKQVRALIPENVKMLQKRATSSTRHHH